MGNYAPQVDPTAPGDVKLALEQSVAGVAAKDQPPSAIGEIPTWKLPGLAGTRKNPAAARWYWIEFHRRFALPTACLVLGLVGFPLGMSAKKGGKSTGFVLTVAR